MIRRSFDWDSDNFVIARIGHHCFYGEHDDGGQSSAGMDGGSQNGEGNPADQNNPGVNTNVNESNNQDTSSTNSTNSANPVGPGTGRNKNNPAKGHSFDGVSFGASFDSAVGTVVGAFQAALSYAAYDDTDIAKKQQEISKKQSTVAAYDFDTHTSPNQEQNPSYSQPEHALDAIAQENFEAKNSTRTAYQGPGKRGYSPPGYDRNTDNTLSVGITDAEINKFVKSIQTLSKVDQEKAIREFREKNKAALEALAKKTAQTPIGLFGYMPGIGMMNMIGMGMKALAKAMGIDAQVNSPAMDALDQAARQAGVNDKETGEYTVEEMRATCNRMQGYRWDESSNSCVPVQT